MILALWYSRMRSMGVSLEKAHLNHFRYSGSQQVNIIESSETFVVNRVIAHNTVQFWRSLPTVRLVKTEQK